MPRVNYSDPLAAHMASNPVIHHQKVELGEDVWNPTDADMLAVFGNPENRYLRAWCRTGDPAKPLACLTQEMQAHYLGAQVNVPLHIDVSFLRYTMQLILRVDEFELHGHDRIGLPLERGTYFLADTHSPHAVMARPDAKTRPRLYVSASVDSAQPHPPEEVIPVLLALARSENRLPTDFDRIRKFR
jgi:hypothetical protein